MIATDGACRIALQFQLTEAHAQCIVEQQPILERSSLPQDDLDGFGRLNDSDETGEDAEHAALGATGNETRGRWLRIQAAIAGAVFIREYGGLPFETENGSVHIRLLQQNAGIVHQVTSGEVVGAVNDDVVVAKNVQRVFAVQRDIILFNLQIRIDVLHFLGGGIELFAADIFGAVNDLALQIGDIDLVEIDKTDAANP